MSTKYKATVEKGMVGEGISFSVTHNGNHWTSIRVEDPLYEIPMMILALQNYLIGHGIGCIHDATYCQSGRYPNAGAKNTQ